MHGLATNEFRIIRGLFIRVCMTSRGMVYFRGLSAPQHVSISTTHGVKRGYPIGRSLHPFFANDHSNVGALTFVKRHFDSSCVPKGGCGSAVVARKHHIE